jgi:hypothetical protein
MPSDEPVSRPPPRKPLYLARRSLSYKDEGLNGYDAVELIRSPKLARFV